MEKINSYKYVIMTLKEKRDLVHYIGGGFIAYIFGFITAMYSYVGIGNGIKSVI